MGCLSSKNQTDVKGKRGTKDSEDVRIIFLYNFYLNRISSQWQTTK
jgi:hypothetical protein